VNNPNNRQRNYIQIDKSFSLDRLIQYLSYIGLKSRITLKKEYSNISHPIYMIIWDVIYIAEIYVLQAKLKFSFTLFTIQHQISELILSFAQSLISNWVGGILIRTNFSF